MMGKFSLARAGIKLTRRILMVKWNDCEHVWEIELDSQFHSEKKVAVTCIKCKCPGEQNLETKQVFWPAT